MHQPSQQTLGQPHRGQGPSIRAPHPYRARPHQQGQARAPVALDDDSQGKTALLEFPEGWQRTIALPTQADAWHPMFDDLAEAEHKRLRAHVAPPVVFHPDGTRTRQGAMSFVRVEVNRVGGWLGERCFDVPPEDYNSGSITGYRCAGELLEALQRAYGPHIHLTDILDEVMATQNGSYGKSGRRGEAVAFMEVVKVTMAFFAKHVHHADYVAARIEIGRASCRERV